MKLIPFSQHRSRTWSRRATRLRIEELERRDVPSAVCEPAEDHDHDEHDEHHFDQFGNEYHELSVLPDDRPPPSDNGPREPPYPLGDTFKLHSRPTANHVIYLDFDGHVTSGTLWNSNFNGGADFNTPAYDTNSNTSSFSNTELEAIQRIYQRVMEDFAPFDVDVTTEFPGIERLRRTGTSDTQWGVRVVIGGDGSWYNPNVGGVAYVGSFNWSSDTPCYVFEDNLGNGNEKYTAEAISHEAGHTLGLSHDGRNTDPPEGYYTGHGSGATGWAPIMGVGYYRELTQWSKGEYPLANQPQDDLAIMTTNYGFGYRADDHGNTRTAASSANVSGTTLTASGNIERRTDVDYFKFLAGAGNISLTISPFERGPNLDILAELYNSSGALVASSNPSTLLSASLSTSVPAGEYFILIDGVGKGDLTTGYSDYGSLGQYAISGTIVAPDPNDAPVLDNSGDMFLSAITEGDVNNSGTLISAIIASAGGDRITDADSGAVEGIAIIASDTGNGSWEYSTNNGGSWSALGAVSATNGRLLASDSQTRIRLRPNATFSGTIASAITFRAWDQTSGSNGGTGDPSTNGGTTAFSTATETARITVNPVNDAPVLDNTSNMALGNIAEDDVNNNGTLISAIIDSAGGDRITDADDGALEGIAVTAADTHNGSWQYSINNGSNWFALGTVSASSSRLLASDSQTRIRFAPNADFNGSIATAITFRAWDQTNGTNGSLADTRSNGGATAFSVETESASLDVTAVNDAPLLDPSGDMLLGSILEDQVSNSGTTIVDLIASAGGDRITDVDSGALEGIAVMAVDTTHGSWSYSLNNGSSWFSMGAVSDTSARLLAATATTRLRFTPNADFNGTLPAAITFRAWDRSGGTVEGDTANSTSNGGTTPFSVNTDTASLTIIAVNDPPSFTKGSDVIIAEDSGSQSRSGWANNLSAGPADENAQTLAFDVTNNSTGLFSVQPAIDSAGTLTFTPAANAAGSATVTVRLVDNGGTDNSGNDTSGPQTFVINITPVNDAPSFVKGEDQTALEDGGLQEVSSWATSISPGPSNEAGQTVTFSVSTNNDPLFAVLPAIDSGGRLIYTPAANASGSATVSVVLQDNGGTADGGDDQSDPQLFTIVVAPVNDAPSFTKGVDQAVDEDPGPQFVPDWASNMSAGPADENGQQLSFEVVENSDPSLFADLPAIDAEGDLTYTPKANASGMATISVRIVDNGGSANGGQDASESQSFTITINPVNDAPDARPDNVTAIIGRPLAINLLANDSDVDYDRLRLVSYSTPTNGQLRRNGNAVVYTTRLRTAGVDSFTYTVTDDQGGFDTETVSISIRDRIAPTTRSVQLHYGSTTYAEALSLNRRVLPWERLTRISIVFSEGVTVDPGALTLIGPNGAITMTFSYDAVRQTATWTPLTPIENGRFTIRLSASGIVDVSGNQLARDWTRSFGLLAGDYDGNGIVTSRDLLAIRRRFTRPGIIRDRLADIDGNGFVDQADFNIAMRNRGKRLL